MYQPGEAVCSTEPGELPNLPWLLPTVIISSVSLVSDSVKPRKQAAVRDLLWYSLQMTVRGYMSHGALVCVPCSDLHILASPHPILKAKAASRERQHIFPSSQHFSSLPHHRSRGVGEGFVFMFLWLIRRSVWEAYRSQHSWAFQTITSTGQWSRAVKFGRLSSYPSAEISSLRSIFTPHTIFPLHWAMRDDVHMFRAKYM